MAEDLKSAVYNPAAAVVSPTYVAKGAQLDNIVADARIKYLAGQIDEQGLKDAIKLWQLQRRRQGQGRDQQAGWQPTPDAGPGMTAPARPSSPH